MRCSRTPISTAVVLLALSLLVVIAAGALAACGTPAPPTQLPTRTSPVAALSFPAREATKAHLLGSIDGLEFVPWVDVEVSALGYYDDSGDGFRHAHTVAIFEKSTERLVTPTVTVDSESMLQERYRYKSITPVVLKSGSAYVVAGDSFAPFDPVVLKPKGLAGAPEIRFVTSRSSAYSHIFVSGTFQFPKKSFKNGVGPMMNFLFMPVTASSPTP